jgi:death-on-curing protein
VFRPQTGYYEDSIAEAAALFESLIQNHPYIDGNKRMALGAMDVHLRMNGIEWAVLQTITTVSSSA